MIDLTAIVAGAITVALVVSIYMLVITEFRGVQ
jgi:hypothetical protein